MTLPVVLGIAGCIAFLVGVFGGGVKAKQLEVPKLPILPRVLSSIGGLVLIGIAVFVYFRNPPSPGTPATSATAGIMARPILTVQIWDIVNDQKNALVASEQFSTAESDTTLSQVGHWITQQIMQRYDLSAPPLQVHVHIPADLSREKLSIEAGAPVPFHVYFWDVAAGMKQRVPIDVATDSALASLNRDFDLEINPVGYTTETVHVTWGQPMEKDLVLEQRPVAIAVEDFRGEQNSYAAQVANYLTINSRFAIKEPAALQRLEDQIATEQAYIAANPQVQTSSRTSLGVDLLITGTLQEP